MNLTLELTTEQIIDLVQQMPPEEKFLVVRALKGNTGRTRGTDEVCRIKGSRIM